MGASSRLRDGPATAGWLAIAYGTFIFGPSAGAADRPPRWHASAEPGGLLSRPAPPPRARVLCNRALSHASPVLRPMGIMTLLRSSRAPFRLRVSLVMLLLLPLLLLMLLLLQMMSFTLMILKINQAPHL